MKKASLFIFSLLISSAALSASHELQIDLKANESFYNKVLERFWKDVPNEMAVPRNRVIDEDIFKVDIVHGHVKLGPTGKKLFTFVPLGDNAGQINWHLNESAVNVRLKATFKKNVLGAQITVIEEFDVKASIIQNAKSIFKIGFSNGRFELADLKTSGVNFEKVSIKSTDDNFTTWVLKKLNTEVKFIVNAAIADHLSSEEDFIGPVKEFANAELKLLEDTSFEVGMIASKLNLRAKKFSFEKENLLLNGMVSFDNRDTRVHECAVGLLPQQKSNVLIPHKFIEELVLSLSTFEKDEDGDGLIDEPLFCYGYKDGRADGEEADFSFEIMGREVRPELTYWARPTTPPTFKYEIGEKPEDHVLTVKMGAELKVESKGTYPLIILSQNKVAVELETKLQVKLVKGMGMMLSLKKLSINQFTGAVYVKLGKFLPKVIVPYGLMKSNIESALSEAMAESLSENILVNEVISLPHMDIKLKNYEMSKEQHKINFEIIH